LLVWVTPSLEQVGWCVLLGLAGSTGHVCMARALANADTTLVVPLDYIRLPAVALIAYLAFGEVADLWTWLGAAVIAASGIYITLRDARVGRAAPAAEVVERAP
jgi:drug/metabolite transporter (DMT)-like permease